MDTLQNLINKYFMGHVPLEAVVAEADRQGLTAEQLINTMRQKRILFESEHAEDLILLSKEAEAIIKSMMSGDKK